MMNNNDESMSKLDRLDQERKEARQKAERNKKREMVLGTGLRLKDADVISFRFLCDVGGMYFAKYHHCWDDRNRSMIQSMCATSYGSPCHYCELAKTSKSRKLLPLDWLVSPIWVYSLENVYDEKPKNQDVKGIRFLMHKRTGSTSVTGTMSSYQRSEGSLMGCDWRYQRNGSDIETSYELTPRPPSSFTEHVNVPSEENMHAFLAEVFPYRPLTTWDPYDE